MHGIYSHCIKKVTISLVVRTVIHVSVLSSIDSSSDVVLMSNVKQTTSLFETLYRFLNMLNSILLSQSTARPISAIKNKYFSYFTSSGFVVLPSTRRYNINMNSVLRWTTRRKYSNYSNLNLSQFRIKQKHDDVVVAKKYRLVYSTGCIPDSGHSQCTNARTVYA